MTDVKVTFLALHKKSSKNHIVKSEGSSPPMLLLYVICRYLLLSSEITEVNELNHDSCWFQMLAQFVKVHSLRALINRYQVREVRVQN